MVQTKYKLNHTELFLKLFHISIFREKNWKQQVIRRNSTDLKNGKVKLRLNIDVRKEMENSRLNAIECHKKLITYIKVR